MRKTVLFLLISCFFLHISILSIFAEDEKNGGFFISGGYSKDFFNDKPIRLVPGYITKDFSFTKLGINYEWLLGPGNFSLGLEAGYSSGSMFGGTGSIDYIPLNLTTYFDFPLAKVFYLGPSLKIGTLVISGPNWNKATLMAGARLEAELRSSGFPLGLYIAGGADFFPTAYRPGVLPMAEIGLRFPRGKLKFAEKQEAIKKDDDSIPVAIAEGGEAGAGATGTPGAGDGAAGTTGTPGAAAGAAGTTGTPAAGTGAAGTTGTPAAGAAGTTGTPAAGAGAAGTTGTPAAGAAGTTGTPGATAGTAGTTGTPAAGAGAAGTTGTPAAGTGAAGTTGTPAAGAGAAGTTGTPAAGAGAAGTTGTPAAGAAGTTGTPAAGAAGATGTPGTGAAGTTGTPGAGAGAAGTTGTPAAGAGAVGTTGTPAAGTGAAGTTGTPGATAGAAGTTGTPAAGAGAAGTTGTPGAVTGAAGTTATPGSSSTTVPQSSQFTVPDQGRRVFLDGGRQGTLRSIYFEPDTAVLIEMHRPTLELVGQLLTSNPYQNILLKAYAANFGTANGRYLVSLERARFCRDYFIRNYGIASERINFEAYGADRDPEAATDDWMTHRCVELILIDR